jgi:hypothetical protein
MVPVKTGIMMKNKEVKRKCQVEIDQDQGAEGPEQVEDSDTVQDTAGPDGQRRVRVAAGAVAGAAAGAVAGAAAGAVAGAAAVAVVVAGGEITRQILTTTIRITTIRITTTTRRPGTTPTTIQMPREKTSRNTSRIWRQSWPMSRTA